MWEVLIEPFGFALDPAKRIYWGCLLSALVLASAFVSVRERTFDPRAQLSRFMNRRYWINASTAQDVGWLFANNAIKGLVLLPIIGSHLALTLVVGGQLQMQLGDAPDLEFPLWLIAGTYTASYFVLEDLSRFLLHMAMHRNSWLWKLHRIHHSAKVLTPLTLFRVHPIEQALYFFRGVIVFGFVSGIFIWLFGRELSAWDILGVDLFGFAFNALGANLRHSHIPLGFGHFERWIISPRQHQLHHSVDHGHCNLGVCLAAWDRIAGTAVSMKLAEPLRFGLNEDVVPEGSDSSYSAISENAPAWARST